MKSKHARVYVAEGEQPLIQFLTQYFDPTQFVPGNSTDVAPEQKLLIALIQDALHALEHSGSSKLDRKRHIDAVKWFRKSRAMKQDLFSFSGVCERLGLSEDYVRKMIFGRERAP